MRPRLRGFGAFSSGGFWAAMAADAVAQMRGAEIEVVDWGRGCAFGGALSGGGFESALIMMDILATEA